MPTPDDAGGNPVALGAMLGVPVVGMNVDGLTSPTTAATLSEESAAFWSRRLAGSAAAPAGCPMSFVSWAFVILFTLVLAAAQHRPPKKSSLEFVLVLFLASTVFYAWHVPIYLLVLLTSAGIDYWAALALARPVGEQRTKRRWILAVSMTGNLRLVGVLQ